MSIVSAKTIHYPDIVPIQTALISVFDKKGIVPFARSLLAQKVKLISTGGTFNALRESDIPVNNISQITGFPEILDGRVKTLHPLIHAGLLGLRDDPAHAKTLETLSIPLIDLLVVNLYPFSHAVEANHHANVIIENIDIGGPAMIRAGAKNHGYISVVTDCNDYNWVLKAIQQEGGLKKAAREQLAAQAFAHTARYEAAISTWFAQQTNLELDKERIIGGTRQQELRYGENPHQQAAFYKTDEIRVGVATAETIQGKPLSYNNIHDTDAAFELVSEFDARKQAAVAIIKHANPCGVATAETLNEAYKKALMCDPVSAFGSIIALNRMIDAGTAEQILKIFTEVIIAPAIEEQAKQIFAQKPNLRVLITGAMGDPHKAGYLIKSVAGGLLVQSRDNITIDEIDFNIVTKRAPTKHELSDLRFAYIVAKHVKSNAIVYAKDGMTVGIGAGQMSRVDAVRIAAQKSLHAVMTAHSDNVGTNGSVVASDAFFPFSDGLLEAAKAGATAVIQPGGSRRDEEVITAANEAGMAMIFTGYRHFRH